MSISRSNIEATAELQNHGCWFFSGGEFAIFGSETGEMVKFMLTFLLVQPRRLACQNWEGFSQDVFSIIKKENTPNKIIERKNHIWNVIVS